MEPGQVEIVDLTVDDLDALVELHQLTFPDSELARLGREAVKRQYRWQMEGPHDLTALGARRDRELVGFLMGGVFRGSTLGFLRKEKWFLARLVVTHPRILLRGSGRRSLSIAARLLRPDRKRQEPNRPARGSFGVQAIGVSPRAQRLGIARRLMVEAEARARAEGYATMHLTVHPDNAAAVGLYFSLGWVRLHPPTDNESQWRLGKDLAEDAPAAG